MQVSVDNAYQIFKQENKHEKIGKSSFYSLRPKRVIKLSQQQRETCLCPYCLNVDFKLSALRRACVLCNVRTVEPLTSTQALMDLILCSNGDREGAFYKAACIEGLCVQCKDVEHTIKTYYKDLLRKGVELGKK